jgi:hypothetical protein
MMGEIADQAVALKIDRKIEHFQGNLANEYRHAVGNLHHIHRAKATFKGYTHGLVHRYRPNATA